MDRSEVQADKVSVGPAKSGTPLIASARAKEMREAIVEADGLARHAARLAGVTVSAMEVSEVGAVQELVVGIWGEAQRPQSNLLLAMRHGGTALGVARRGGVPVGFCMGWLGWNDGLHMHSHMAGVDARAHGAGIGYALKLWQRGVALAHGVGDIRWTYDPLVARNGHFNGVKLGARVVGFMPDAYGSMDDTINAGDRSDRFLVSWSLADPLVVRTLNGSLDRPRPDRPGPLLHIPPDYDTLRGSDPELAAEVRESVRAHIQAYWALGLRPHWVKGGYRFSEIW